MECYPHRDCSVFEGGNILTMEETSIKAETLAVQFGRIYRVGKTVEIENLAGPVTKVVDLKGQTLFPGIIDKHNRFYLYALLTDQAECWPGAAIRYTVLRLKTPFTHTQRSWRRRFSGSRVRSLGNR